MPSCVFRLSKLWPQKCVFVSLLKEFWNFFIRERNIFWKRKTLFCPFLHVFIPFETFFRCREKNQPFWKSLLNPKMRQLRFILTYLRVRRSCNEHHSELIALTESDCRLRSCSARDEQTRHWSLDTDKHACFLLLHLLVSHLCIYRSMFPSSQSENWFTKPHRLLSFCWCKTP